LVKKFLHEIVVCKVNFRGRLVFVSEGRHISELVGINIERNELLELLISLSYLIEVLEARSLQDIFLLVSIGLNCKLGHEELFDHWVSIH
jgi:hypothetical protein